MTNLLDLPIEVLEPICRLLVAKNSGPRRCIDLTSDVCLKYKANYDECHIFEHQQPTYYNAELQVLRVCRRLHDIGVNIVYGEHRFTCLQTDSFMRFFAPQIRQTNLAKIAFLHLHVPREWRISMPESFIEFLVSQMPELNILELSKRWCFFAGPGNGESGPDMHDRKRALMLWLGQQLLQKHPGLKHVSWTETITRVYPDDDYDDPIWVRVTVTLSSRPAATVAPFRSVISVSRPKPSVLVRRGLRNV